MEGRTVDAEGNLTARRWRKGDERANKSEDISRRYRERFRTRLGRTGTHYGGDRVSILRFYLARAIFIGARGYHAGRNIFLVSAVALADARSRFTEG